MRKREKEIRIMATETEYQTILANAKKVNMQVAPYIRKVAQNPEINQIDYKIIFEHTKEIGEIRNSINRLIFSIEASNNYLPREIDSIVEMMNKIFETENKLLQTLRKERKKTSDKNYRTQQNK